MQYIYDTVFEPTNCRISNEYSFVIYVPSTLFDLYKVFIREAHGEAHKYSKFCQRCAYVEG
jgi:hypothetical protein